MKKIQIDFCNREQTVPGNKNWPRGGGAFSKDFAINLSPQCRAFSRVLKTEKLKALLFPIPLGARTTNDVHYLDLCMSFHKREKENKTSSNVRKYTSRHECSAIIHISLAICID